MTIDSKSKKGKIKNCTKTFTLYIYKFFSKIQDQPPQNINQIQICFQLD